MKYIDRLRNNPNLFKNKTLMSIYRFFKYQKKQDGYTAIPNLAAIHSFFYIESFGEKNKDINIYLMELDCKGVGLFAILRKILNGLYISDRFGFVPCVIVANSPYNDGVQDAFQRFFEPLSTITCNEAYNSFNVVRYHDCHGEWIEKQKTMKFTKNQREYNLIGGYNVTDELIERLAGLKSKYIICKSHVLNNINLDISRILSSKRIIGVHYRGNAYKDKVYGHPVPLDVSDYFKYIDECLNCGYEKIFVATDELEAIRIFRRKYSSKILTYKDVLRSRNGIDVHFLKSGRKDNGYMLGYEVLRDMYTLAACRALICGISQVTIWTRIEKRSRGEYFDYLKIINKGINSSQNYKYLENYNIRKK